MSGQCLPRQVQGIISSCILQSSLEPGDRIGVSRIADSSPPELLMPHAVKYIRTDLAVLLPLIQVTFFITFRV